MKIKLYTQTTQNDSQAKKFTEQESAKEKIKAFFFVQYFGQVK
jgi:hypothetical protein